MKNKKGMINITGILIGVFIFIVMGAIISLILVSLRGSSTNNNFTGAIDNGTTFVGNIFQQLPLAGTVAGLGLVLALVFIAIFAAIRKSGGGGGGL